MYITLVRGVEALAKIGLSGREWHTSCIPSLHLSLHLMGQMEKPLVCLGLLLKTSCVCTHTHTPLSLETTICLSLDYSFCTPIVSPPCYLEEVMLEQSYKMCQNYESLEGWWESGSYIATWGKSGSIHKLARLNICKASIYHVCQTSVQKNNLLMLTPFTSRLIGKGIPNFSRLRKLKSVSKG